MSLREIAAIAEANGLGFTVERGSIVIAYTFNRFQPYKLQPVNIEDWYRKHLDNRSMKPIKPQARVFPTDPGEYRDYLEEQMRNSVEDLEARQQEREEARRQGIRDCHESAEEKWRPRDRKAEREENREYLEKLEAAQHRLPGFKKENHEKLRIQRK